MGHFRSHWTAFLVAALLVVFGTEATAKTTKDQTQAKLTKKVFFTQTKKAWVPDMRALATELSKSKTPLATKVKRVAGTDRWSTTLMAFFRKKSYPGPITVWFYDKADKGAIRASQPTHVMSLASKPQDAVLYTLDLYGDDGFNKGRTYIVRVGQLIGRRERIYATGELTLMP